MDDEKAEFLKEFGQDYGYPDAPKPIDEIRATEFKRLEGVVYLDHAGATLSSDLQMEAVFKELTATVLGNPHSQSDASMATSEIVREARQQVLEYFNASPGEYSCIFTSGATAALKLVGEAFPWSSRSRFMYTMENHNSVLGIREYALDQGAAAYAVDIEESMQCGKRSVKVSRRSRQRRLESCDDKAAGDAYNLFALPSECNFSGVRFNLDLVKKIKEDSQNILGGSDFRRRNWLVLIDAAKGCATEKVDLSKYPADFVVMSFYKLFGYPTGLGALIVRKESIRLLRKKYFSGGTVAASIADLDFVKRREDVEESFEYGTTSFLSIASIRHGFKLLNSLTVPAISRHTASLAMYTRKVLLELKHENGAKLCTIYGGQTSEDMGPTIAFNLKRSDGYWFGYREVEKLASLSGIQLRTGCFCNPGACAKYLGLSHLDLLSNLEAGHVCWDDNDILNGKPTGAVRVSFGYMSTYEDAKKFIDFLKKSFTTSGNHWTPLCPQRLSAGRGIRIRSIHIYPVKSCGGFSVESWPLSSTGFLHDRAWVLKSLTGEILTLKKVPSLGLMRTFIDLRRGKLVIETPRCKDKLEIDIDPDSQEHAKEKIDVYARRYDVHTYNEDINMWFSDAVGRPCSLLRSAISRNSVCSKENHCEENNSKENGSNAGCRDIKCQLNFANEAQFLLISEESLSDLNTRLKSAHEERGAQQSSTRITPNRFRPNLVISGGGAFEEDSWASLRIGGNLFTSMGGCNRCQMINMTTEGDEVIKSKEPLATLASYRRQKGKILFGVLLRYKAVAKEEEDGDYKSIKVGDEVHPRTESAAEVFTLPELPKVESSAAEVDLIL